VADLAALSHRNLASTVPPGDPGAGRLFDPAVYERGALTLHALDRTIGDEAFDEVVRRWAANRAGGNGSTSDFVALAEQVSGQDLDALFLAWLHSPELPPLPA
jgi:aminopeptidase N